MDAQVVTWYSLEAEGIVSSSLNGDFDFGKCEGGTRSGVLDERGFRRAGSAATCSLVRAETLYVGGP